MRIRMAYANYDDLVRVTESLRHPNSYQAEGNPLTAGIYSLLIPNSEDELQQVSGDPSKVSCSSYLCWLIKGRVPETLALKLKYYSTERLLSRCDGARHFTFYWVMLVNT